MDEVLIDDRGAWRVITLNRPDRLNSFNAAMHRALATALDAARDPACRAVLLTGAGRGFCAGQDLADVAVTDGAAPDLGVTIDEFYNPLVRRIRALDKPVVCAVNGTAAGAGANIALSCDIVLAARSAKFIQSFAKIGLVPDSGGTWLLPRLIGDARAKALAMLAEPIGAETAAGWGLIWRAVDDDQLRTEAEKLTAHLATQPTQGLALIKQALAAAATNTLDAQLDLERDLQRKAGRTPDYAEGVDAFIAKRTPNFTGRAS
ncbi:enoyl-CoA hydratase [Rhodopseudomonas thermotolerans]|uniref:Enoyl-CoA hydratase n=2 Tax=Rhodopseudomonas TaxID=1073 RepID=A0A336JRN7_9BRAD|nr:MULTISPECIES: 2-(1,2-epoxy-1,2-dihydrophenyl)acetyl-CoA isomerase PaaG [Rhodopseudomonas]RED29676.1 enoyl-CoA hydratase [Rhodopseudomonas pentothenatexigens]REF92437.1 enoyl-CoA hydratase [Rhodopseudomonas thermotolerans]SSW92282.1 enoyl-CoA hydratase [Rhodopseudomonas pentothenatexigens]